MLDRLTQNSWDNCNGLFDSQSTRSDGARPYEYQVCQDEGGVFCAAVFTGVSLSG